MLSVTTVDDQFRTHRGLCKTKFEEMERADGVEGAFVGV
jgi:hypothetical protein